MNPVYNTGMRIKFMLSFISISHRVHTEASSLKREMVKVTKRNNFMRNNIVKHVHKLRITDV